MKERLTGAIILVALIVLLVPELLTGPLRSTSKPQGGATASAEEAPLRSYTIDLADDSRTRGGSSSNPATAPSEAGGPAQQAPADSNAAKPATISEGSPSAESAAPEARPSVEPGEDAKPPEKPAPVARTAAPPAPIAERPVPEKPVAEKPARTQKPVLGSGAWMVQLGVFASRANAERLVQELKGKGFKVAVSEVSGNGRTLYRVRSGAVGDHAAAQALAAKLRAAGANGSVVPRT